MMRSSSTLYQMFLLVHVVFRFVFVSSAALLLVLASVHPAVMFSTPSRTFDFSIYIFLPDEMKEVNETKSKTHVINEQLQQTDEYDSKHNV